MRNIIGILAMVIMGSSMAQAQTEKGRWTVGAQVGDLSYVNKREPSIFRNRAFSMSLSPSAGYFVTKNLAVGASIPISYAFSANYLPSGSRSDTDVGIGLTPFVRYYVGSAQLRPFMNASVGYQQFWRSSSGFGNGEPARGNSNMTNYSIGGGVAYFINNTVSLDASLNYTNGLGGSFRQMGRADLNIGFRLFFGK